MLHVRPILKSQTKPVCRKEINPLKFPHVLIPEIKTNPS